MAHSRSCSVRIQQYWLCAVRHWLCAMRHIASMASEREKTQARIRAMAGLICLVKLRGDHGTDLERRPAYSVNCNGCICAQKKIDRRFRHMICGADWKTNRQTISSTLDVM